MSEQQEQPESEVADLTARPSEDLPPARPEFTRAVQFAAAFDKRDPDPKKDYGIHGVACVFTLTKGGKGVTFSIYTNWMLPHVQAETDARPLSGPYPFLFHKPQPAGVDYHDTKPHYEGQMMRPGCLITGGDCYCDGSYTLGDELFALLVKGGSDALWTRMEALYVDWIEAEPVEGSSTPVQQTNEGNPAVPSSSSESSEAA